jgi:hypothetical protein
MIALASIDTERAEPGTVLEMEVTVEAKREKAAAKAVKLPFFSPARKTAVPV